MAQQPDISSFNKEEKIWRYRQISFFERHFPFKKVLLYYALSTVQCQMFFQISLYSTTVLLILPETLCVWPISPVLVPGFRKDHKMWYYQFKFFLYVIQLCAKKTAFQPSFFTASYALGEGSFFSLYSLYISSVARRIFATGAPFFGKQK